MAAKQKQRRDYYALFHTYKTVKESTGMTLKAFCESENLSYGAVRKAFLKIKKNSPESQKAKRPKNGSRRSHDWEAYRIEFLQSDFKTISAFVRSKGIKPKTGIVSKKTKGWLKERAEIEAKKREKINDEILEKEKRKRFGELEGQVLARFYSGMKAFETLQRFQNRYDKLADELEKEDTDEKDKFKIMAFMDPRGLKEYASATTVTVEGVAKLFSLIVDFEEAKKSKELIQKLIDGDKDIQQVALEIAAMGGNLPEAVKIMLSKTVLEEPEADMNEFPSNEELDRLARERMEEIERQKSEFVPQRQREIAKLKEECKDTDSFSDGQET